MTCSLRELPEHVKARIVRVDGDKHLIHSLLALGLRSNTFVTVIRKLFFGENIVLEVGGEYLVIRQQEAKYLTVTT